MRGIVLDDSGQMIVANGTLSIGEVNDQIIERVALSVPGDFKEKPLLGLNVMSMINGSVDEFFPNECKDQLKGEHIKVTNVSISENEIIIT